MSPHAASRAAEAPGGGDGIRRGLRRDGGILLVSCYEQGQQPLGVAAPLGVLRRAGFRARGTDVAVEPLPAERIDAAGFVAISAPMHTALRIGARVADRVHERNPAARIAFYGHYAWLNREHLFGRHHADYVLAGECEEPLRVLAEAIDAGHPADALAGVTTRTNGRRPHVARPRYVPPSREGLPDLSLYARLEHGGRSRRVGAVQATRGCKHTCRHCPLTPVYRGRFFAVPVDVVLADVEALAERGMEHVTFADPDFLNGPTHAFRVARALHARFPSLSFDVTAKVEHLVRRSGDLPELASLGCLFVVSAVESLSDTVLARLEKGHTRNDVFRALEATRAAGIALRPSLLPFTPWSTLEDYFDLLDFIEDEDLVDAVDPIQLAIRLLVPPGSALLEGGALAPYLTGLAPDELSYGWRHPDPRMDALQERVMGLVARAAEEGGEDEVTFRRIVGAAEEAADRPRPVARAPRTRRRREKAPRLTEPWFC